MWPPIFPGDRDSPADTWRLLRRLALFDRRSAVNGALEVVEEAKSRLPISSERSVAR
jgi:hypothetical protein